MGHYCSGGGCRTWISDEVSHCTECREKERQIEQAAAANLHEIQHKLVAHRLFAEWLTKHPEYDKEDE